MTVVLDTNVLVSGLLRSQGNPAQTLALILSGALGICLSREIFAGYKEVLSRPRFQFDPNQIQEILTKLDMDGDWVDIAGAPALGLPDPDDEPFVRTALKGGCDFVITGNTADFPSDKCHNCKILSPAAFMEYWRAKTSPPS
jgi:uncharacterized protein